MIDLPSLQLQASYLFLFVICIIRRLFQIETCRWQSPLVSVQFQNLVSADKKAEKQNQKIDHLSAGTENCELYIRLTTKTIRRQAYAHHAHGSRDLSRMRICAHAWMRMDDGKRRICAHAHTLENFGSKSNTHDRSEYADIRSCE